MINQTKQLFKEVGAIVKHHRAISILKGEDFNLFSILKMESAENKTHSAFLGELLNPNGRHHLGSTFLKLFLEFIDHNKPFEVEGAILKLEQPIGKRNNETKEGGRIDIYIKDIAGNIISIENKIYARDQYAQIERYVNHKKSKNTVYYLTLEHEEPSKESLGNLEVQQGYKTISYRDHVLKWLKACQKEAVTKSTVRDGIGQYITLIKKLTFQLTDQRMQEELIKITADNYNLALMVRESIPVAEKQKTFEFLKEVVEELEKKYPKEDFLFSLDSFDEGSGGLKITSATKLAPIEIQLVGQQYIWENVSVLGAFYMASSPNYNEYEEKLKDLITIRNKNNDSSGNLKSDYFIAYQRFLNFQIPSEREKLFNQTEREKLMDYVVSGISELLDDCIKRLN